MHTPHKLMSEGEVVSPHPLPSGERLFLIDARSRAGALSLSSVRAVLRVCGAWRCRRVVLDLALVPAASLRTVAVADRSGPDQCAARRRRQAPPPKGERHAAAPGCRRVPGIHARNLGRSAARTALAPRWHSCANLPQTPAGWRTARCALETVEKLVTSPDRPSGLGCVECHDGRRDG